MPLKDARDYQIIFLSVFLSLGIMTRDWTIRGDLILVIIASCLITQFLLSLIDDFVKTKQNKKEQFNYSFSSLYHIGITSFRSALITALGLCLLLRANNYNTMILAGVLAIFSKFIFRVENKHFFNPANFGIITALIFTQDAWVSPGQWGNDWWYLLLFLGTGGIILKRVGRLDTSATFFLTYASLEVIRNVWLGWSFDVVQHQLMSGSLLLFALFMVTDPRSIPNATSSRLIWAISIAILAFIIQHQFYISTGIFWALFILSPLTLILDKYWKAPRFSWQENSLNFNLKILS